MRVTKIPYQHTHHPRKIPACHIHHKAPYNLVFFGLNQTNQTTGVKWILYLSQWIRCMCHKFTVDCNLWGNNLHKTTSNTLATLAACVVITDIHIAGHHIVCQNISFTFCPINVFCSCLSDIIGTPASYFCLADQGLGLHSRAVGGSLTLKGQASPALLWRGELFLFFWRLLCVTGK